MSHENYSKPTQEFNQYELFEDFLKETFASKEFEKLCRNEQNIIYRNFDELGFGVESISQTILRFREMPNSKCKESIKAQDFLEMTQNVLVSVRNSKAEYSNQNIGNLGFNNYSDLYTKNQLINSKEPRINDQLKLDLGLQKFKKLQKESQQTFQNNPINPE